MCSSCLPKHCLQLCGTPEKCRSRCESCLWSVSTRKWCSRALGPLTSLVALHVSVSCNFSFSIVCFATLLPSLHAGKHRPALPGSPGFCQNMSFKSELSWAPHPQNLSCVMCFCCATVAQEKSAMEVTTFTSLHRPHLFFPWTLFVGVRVCVCVCVWVGGWVGGCVCLCLRRLAHLLSRALACPARSSLQ